MIQPVFLCVALKMPLKKVPKPQVGQSRLSFAAVKPQSTAANRTQDDCVSPESSQSTEGSDADTRPMRSCSSSEKAKEPVQPRCWQEKWLHTYPWLRYDSSKNEMFCEVCHKKSKKNAMEIGTDNFRTSALTRHVQRSDHQLLLLQKKKKE